MIETTKQDCLLFLLSLLPPGQINRSLDGNFAKLLDTPAGEIDRINTLAKRIIEEADPRTSMDFFAEWEAFAGLPDNCSIISDSFAERRAKLIQKLKFKGGQSIAFYEAVADTLGYNIEIRTFRPFIAGRSRCGDSLNNGAASRFIWAVKVIGPRVDKFKAGVSRCGERLGTVRRAEDLECIFHRLNQSHADLIFNYEGV